jgi:hypothetical protein
MDEQNFEDYFNGQNFQEVNQEEENPLSEEIEEEPSQFHAIDYVTKSKPPPIGSKKKKEGKGGRVTVDDVADFQKANKSVKQFLQEKEQEKKANGQGPKVKKTKTPAAPSRMTKLAKEFIKEKDKAETLEGEEPPKPKRKSPVKRKQAALSQEDEIQKALLTLNQYMATKAEEQKKQNLPVKASKKAAVKVAEEPQQSSVKKRKQPEVVEEVEGKKKKAKRETPLAPNEFYCRKCDGYIFAKSFEHAMVNCNIKKTGEVKQKAQVKTTCPKCSKVVCKFAKNTK